MAVKRAIDAVAALLGLVLLSPLLALIAIAVRLDSPGPALYRARRIGKDGRPFAMYKFRTMVAGADRQGPAVTAGGDRRVTRIGRWLRRSKLDELPQLLNVLRGDMSLVGPRPEDLKYVALYTPAQREVLCVRPGITGLATVKYRHEEQLLAAAGDLEATYRQVMQEKLAFDLEYVRRRSLWLDLRIILATLMEIAR
ncbi:MAG TPA: sugar transferase [Anaerolineae bacterium]|nr:sugar transferase [Anaerolineae bacterium]HOR00749.1 sugar transferase [Anaerolineae bacterium]HPL27252.1 sugar transferase [Anaerolineae bacterium]